MKKAINNKNILHFLAKEAVNNLHCDISGICSYSAELISLRLLKEGFSGSIWAKIGYLLAGADKQHRVLGIACQQFAEPCAHVGDH